MILSTEQLIQFLDSLSAPQGSLTCAIDTEADSLHRYQESLCLIQFAGGEEVRLIDPLCIDDLAPLSAFLSKATVWMHGADYDMTMLKREFGEIPATVYDTQIGARLLGAKRYGLADLVENHFDIKLSKSSQKADWGKRPLSPKMIEYAKNDVRYLLPMGEKIIAELKALGRFEWFTESCSVARRKVLDRSEQKEENWRVQGAGKLSREGLALLKTLWFWRDAEARSWDRPTFMVASNRQILTWSGQLSEGKKVKLPDHFRGDRIKRFHSAVAKARSMSEEEWPIRPKSPRAKKPKDFEENMAVLTNTRNKVAKELNLERSLIAPRATLEALATGVATPQEALMRWQRECLGL